MKKRNYKELWEQLKFQIKYEPFKRRYSRENLLNIMKALEDFQLTDDWPNSKK